MNGYPEVLSVPSRKSSSHHDLATRWNDGRLPCEGNEVLLCWPIFKIHHF